MELINFYDEQDSGVKIGGTNRGARIRKKNRSTGMSDPDGKNGIKAGSRFTNTVVPRFDGGGCWQQHLQIVQAIVKSNGWSEGTAALQLFAHLDGEALNGALLMPEEEREKMGRSIQRSFGVSQHSREIRECDSPTGSGSGYVRHRAGNPRSAGIRGHEQARP